MDNNVEILKTKIMQGNNREFNNLRLERISEAIKFKSGSLENPKKIIISKITNNKEVCFLKPGKEAFRDRPNIYDMLPCILKDGDNEFEKFSFDDIWEYLIKISIINQLSFKKVLTIIYRICYFYDHKYDNKNNIRYLPDKKLWDYITKLDFSLKEGFADKFKKEDFGLIEFLYFIDLLGWNEDVKYNVVNHKPQFRKNKRTGRINTLLSIISVPLMVNEFLANIIDNVNFIERINVRLILSTMQKLSKSRGICVLTNKELIYYLKQFLYK